MRSSHWKLNLNRNCQKETDSDGNSKSDQDYFTDEDSSYDAHRALRSNCKIKANTLRDKVNNSRRVGHAQYDMGEPEYPK